MFHDHALASEIRKVEQRFRLGHIRDLTRSIGKLIQERYEFSTAPEAEKESQFSPAEQNASAYALSAQGGRA